MDRSTPLVTIGGIVSRLKPDNSGHIFDVSGMAYDGLSGLGGAVLNIAGSSVPAVSYPGPYWPVGPASEPYSFTGSRDSRKFAAFDRSGWLGINTLGISTGTNYVNLENPGKRPYYAQSGLILKGAAVRVYVPPNITLHDEPAGTRVTVSVESAPPAADAAELPMNYAFAYESPGAVIETSSRGVQTYAGPRVLSSSAAVRLASTYNTNTINYTEHVDTNGDGVPDKYIDGTYAPGNFRLLASATVYFDFEDLVELRDQNVYVEPGQTRQLQFGNIFVELRDVTKGGHISIERGRHMISQPGYKMAESGVVYEIKTDAVYSGTVTIKMSIGDLYWQKQKAGAKIYHCDAAMNCVEEETEIDAYNATIHPARLSPFTLMVPVYDATPPQTALKAFGAREELAGRVWVATETYISLAAEDSSNHDDISGPATTYYLIDEAPAAQCLAVPYDPSAPAASCANPVYAGSFTLAEGSHTVSYMSADNWGNLEAAKTDVLYVDGTAPSTELFAGSVAVVDGGTAFVTNKDSVTITYADALVNGVASGLQAKYRLVDVTPEECRAGTPPAACAASGYAGPFTLTPGTHTVHYAAVDNVGNMSPVKSAYFTVSAANTNAMPGGYIRRFAGNGQYGYSGDGGDALDAKFGGSYGIVKNRGGVFVVDYNFNVVRKIAPDGKVYTVAGTGAAGYGGDGGPATAAPLNRPNDIALDSAGNIYIADRYNNRVRKVDAATGIISTALSITSPLRVAVDNAGILYVADGNKVIYKILPDGQRSVIVNGQISSSVGGLAFDANNNLYIADTYNKRIRKVDASGAMTTVAGGGTLLTDNAPALQKDIGYVSDVAVARDGGLLFLDGYRLYHLDPVTGLVGTLVGEGYASVSTAPIPAALAYISYSQYICVDDTGAAYITGSSVIRELAFPGVNSSADAAVRLYAGGGSVSRADAGSAEAAAFLAAAGSKGLLPASTTLRYI